jgi:hypothetical protein
MFEKKSIQIKDIVTNYNLKKYDFPTWQREERKKDKEYNIFKDDLISSIIEGIDIPKIYLYYKEEEDKYYIIDGGHRIRTITKFVRGDTRAILNKYIKYYSIDVCPKKTPKIVNINDKTWWLSDKDKKRFDETKIDFVIYKDITDKEARTIFNRLNQNKPLTIAECINSYNSVFIDMIRDVSEETYDITSHDENTIKDIYNEVTGRKIDHHEYMVDFVSLFSIIHNKKQSNFTREGENNKYYQPGKSSLKYTRDVIGEDESILKYKNNLIEAIKRVIHTILYIKNKLPNGILFKKPSIHLILALYMLVNVDYKSENIEDIMKDVSPFIMKVLSYGDYVASHRKFIKLMESRATDGEDTFEKADEETIKHIKSARGYLNNDELIRRWYGTSSKDSGCLIMKKLLIKIKESKEIQQKYNSDI